jgi:ferredoxin
MFSDQAEDGELAGAKAELDPAGIMNRGKYPRLKGRFAGLPSALFTPGVLGSGLRLVNRFGSVSAPAIKLVSAMKAFDRSGDDQLLRVADECSMCGACVGVCPAYLLTKDERVTARGKLLAARQFALGDDITKEHAHRIFLCMRCKACEQVCQSKLHLIDVYDEMERRLAEKHGKDEEEIKRFVALAEQSPAYDALVERGLVLGAPSKSVQGGK